MTQEEIKRNQNNRKIAMAICIVLLLLGAVMTAVYMVRAVRYQNAEPVTATIVGYYMTTSGGSTVYAPEYEYTWNGETLTFVSSEFSSASGEIGKEVTLRVSESGKVAQTGSYRLFQVGCICILLALGYAAMMAYSKRQFEKKLRQQPAAEKTETDEETDDE